MFSAISARAEGNQRGCLHALEGRCSSAGFRGLSSGPLLPLRTQLLPTGQRPAVEQLRSSTAWLVCHAYSNLDGFVEQVIGSNAVAALKNRRSVAFVQGCSLVFHGERNLPHSGGGSPILACYPDKRLLDKLDAIADVPALIVLPWQISDIQPWLAAHGAQDILGKSQVEPAAISILSSSARWKAS